MQYSTSPLSVFNAPYPPLDDRFAVPLASNSAGFPYKYKGAFLFTSMLNYRPFYSLPLNFNANC
jgi:hypothetical protein